MNISVTKQHIEEGFPTVGSYCPIALAILAKGKHTNLFVGVDVIEVDGHAYHLPQRARDFIDRFDDGKPVKPFRFQARKLK